MPARRTAQCSAGIAECMPLQPNTVTAVPTTWQCNSGNGVLSAVQKNECCCTVIAVQGTVECGAVLGIITQSHTQKPASIRL